MKITLIDVQSTSGILEASRLPEYIAAVEAAIDLDAYQGIVAIGGRLPVWAYSALLHAVGHPALAAGTFEPRTGSIIITMGHHKDAPKVGDSIPAPEPEKWIKVIIP